MISVIVPIYNVEKYLPRCVDSLLTQTFRDFELILVEDGSPDNCAAICDNYAKSDPRIRVIHKTNGGLSDARNAGLRVSKGEYISFIDSDDWVAPDFLEHMMELLNNEHADICECRVSKKYEEIESSSGTVQDSKSEYSSEDAVIWHYSAEEALRELIQDGVFRQHVWNKLYSRNCIEGVDFPVGKMNEDEFWTFQVFGNAKKLIKTDRILYYYFQRTDSIMGNAFSLKRLDALDGKLNRQVFIEKQFPSLSDVARLNLYGSCIFMGQMSLRYLKGDEKSAAIYKINSIRRNCTKIVINKRYSSPSQLFWIICSRISFWGTVKCKNLLKKGF